MELTTVWFLLIALLWIGYLFLEGFDFGVGMLLPVIGRNDAERRVIINTIAPVWDGNEVWLLVAGGATFAAFPNWYATLFSGFYLALLVILVALIVRGVAFEYRSKRESPGWRRAWDWAIFFGSAVPALLWGVALSNVVRGVPIDAQGDYTGSFFTLLNPYSLLGGLATLGLFLTHGAYFLGLRASGDVRKNATRVAQVAGPATIVIGGAFLLWTQLSLGKDWTWLFVAVAAAALVIAAAASRGGREAVAFGGTGVAIACVVVILFGSLYPNVMPSTTSDAFNLTIHNASSTHYTLAVMTVVALAVTPVVLLYQGWTYWVFRKRIGVSNLPLSRGH
ncbi:MAG: cytochrome d ubiquinol oxidase subunit II [Dehalococcoidia bacterium]